MDTNQTASYVIAGGSGFVGRDLSRLLQENGHAVYVLTTQQRKAGESAGQSGIRYIHWDPSRDFLDTQSLPSSCKLINLAGAGVADKRWTAARKREIMESRVQSLQTLYRAVESGQLKATHLVSVSAIGYYGGQEGLCVEETAGDASFLSSTTQQWEAAATQFEQLGLPVARARIGIVLGKEGGAMREFLKTLSLGIAAIPSHGKQIYSWIHIKDLCRILYFLSEKKEQGVFNAVAPEPVSMNALFEAMIKHTHPFFFRIHVPDAFLKIVLGEMAIEITKSTLVSARKILDHGFQFKYPTIGECMDDLMK